MFRAKPIINFKWSVNRSDIYIVTHYGYDCKIKTFGKCVSAYCIITFSIVTNYNIKYTNLYKVHEVDPFCL